MFYNETISKFLDGRRECLMQAFDSVEDALKVMQEQKTGAVGVEIFSGFAGIFTQSDFVEKVLMKNLSPQKTILNEVMTQNPPVISPLLSTAQAYEVMLQHKVRYLPVLREGDSYFLGIVTEDDLSADIYSAKNQAFIDQTFMERDNHTKKAA